MRIAIDAMGGDNAPAEIVKGCVQASQSIDAKLILVGDQEKLNAELAKYQDSCDQSKLEVVHASEIISGEDSPVQAVRHKKDSSMVRAVRMVADGEADAVLSAGNTGALMISGILVIGKMEGVERPAIVAAVPQINHAGRYTLIVDSGANAECKAEHLLSFGRMGSIYMHNAFGIDDPTVGLINIGTEESKGTSMLKDAYKLLKESGLNFVGNIEARDIPGGLADVLVCDGFTGNIVLKLMEGTCLELLRRIKAVINDSLVSRLGGGLLSGKLREMKSQLDYSSEGAAPILGIDGLVFKMHGSSDCVAVCNAVIKAANLASGSMLEDCRNAMKGGLFE